MILQRENVPSLLLDALFEFRTGNETTMHFDLLDIKGCLSHAVRNNYAICAAWVGIPLHGSRCWRVGPSHH